MERELTARAVILRNNVGRKSIAFCRCGYIYGTRIENISFYRPNKRIFCKSVLVTCIDHLELNAVFINLDSQRLNNLGILAAKPAGIERILIIRAGANERGNEGSGINVSVINYITVFVVMGCSLVNVGIDIGRFGLTVMVTVKVNSIVIFFKYVYKTGVSVAAK